MRKSFLLVALTALAATRPVDLPFEKRTIDLGGNETAAIADLDGDGKLDIVSGENWYAGPAFKQHRFREIEYANNYVDNFSDLPADFDGDGQTDVVSCAWFGKSLTFWKNPGKARGMWKPQMIQEGYNVEFCFLVDLDNDGKALEILPQFGGLNAPMSWYEYKGGKWVRRQVAEKSFGHGIGVGDVNGDGRNDILTPTGWFEAPVDPRTGTWIQHDDFVPMGFKALSFIHVLDVNGDKRPDVIAGNAHDYGLLYLENLGDGKWKKNVIDESWSQPHAVTLVDLNKDGKMDILTGKRYMAHNGKDPGEREPLGIYWYESIVTPGKPVDWARHVVDFSTRTGAGMQIPVADLDGDGDLDFVTPGKSGLFLFENKTGNK